MVPNKTLYFYKILLSTLPLGASSQSLSLKNTFETGYEFHYDNKIIEIIDSSEIYIFGSIGKTNELTRTAPLQRKRKSDSLEKLPDETELPFLTEDYTYFLISGINFDEMVVLRNSKAPNIIKTLEHAILNKNPLLKPTIIMKQIPDLSQKLNKLRNICEITFIANTPDEIRKHRPSIFKSKCLSESDAEKLTVTLLYNNQAIDTETRNELSNRTYNNYTKFSIKGSFEDDSDYPQIIDCIEKIVTKQVTIPIEDNVLKNSIEIKQVLLHQLSLNY